MIPIVRLSFFILGLIASAANAQDKFTPNVFFGFDFILQPIAIKWACGGDTETDLSQIDALIRTFPEDAKNTDLKSAVEVLFKASNHEAGLIKVLGTELSDQQAKQLCTKALPLNMNWITPQQLVADDEEGVPRDQKKALEAFFQFVETLY